MALNQNMDLALLELSALHKLAQQLQIEKWNSLLRPDLVAPSGTPESERIRHTMALQVWMH